ncbi:MAG: radical SAM protein [Deltaproteobacteria bacterium]|nr:radical SAM protein [Deltaproteobacteria bacterium]
MNAALDHTRLYRLPWSLTDNGLSWVEPTAKCNLSCDACYRENRAEHKSFEEMVAELDVLARNRRSDSLVIAGGDPLLYPDLVRLVAEVRRRGYKPMLTTNGHALTTPLLEELKKAGLAGFTFHVDSKQHRPGKWRDMNELELCELRDELADQVAAFDLNCSFIATIYADTVQYIVPMTRWAEERMGKVHVMVFSVYRDFFTPELCYFAGGEEVPNTDPNKSDHELVQIRSVNGPARERMTSRGFVEILKEAFPDFSPSTYLNGTDDPSSLKWLLAGRIGRPGRIFGYVGARFQELIQTLYHLRNGRYLAHPPVESYRRGKLTLLFSLFDRGVRAAAVAFLRDALRHPLRALFQPLNVQSILIIQPIDVAEDGRINMCDSCPDTTVWNGRLVWSCRLDELRKHGTNLSARPRTAVAACAGERSQVPVQAAAPGTPI